MRGKQSAVCPTFAAVKNATSILIMKLKSISPVEKVGFERLRPNHWISHTEITIDASPEQVWEVLMDTASYANWAELLIKVDGKIEDQGRVDVLFRLGKEGKPTLYHNDLHVIEGTEFYWTDLRAMGIKDRHCFRVEPAEGGKTRFIQSDQALGGMAWLLGRVFVNVQIKNYPLFNQSLKAEVERRYA